MAKIDVTELDIFYISYDEPNCEEHWADLLNNTAQRFAANRESNAAGSRGTG